ncbi:BsuBI/PstI family type II restriction endonuclease [Cronbergia sp. UHCC 0137]|uniref:BsuBI/PstI family type II restriction endonuclease n=1 Tax=Cronbergia sp. UHCC 0137 TaxID=3110239 RepID=UPI002B203F01|nr:BsuBI/PstI family type II restriction endonuclease [Cronbergia sp. UHCC 0137]MEA5618076.1 BsuBI/PstI family type II restriction endonuclease [Cronbergia sp. UHCC 0137]
MPINKSRTLTIVNKETSISDDLLTQFYVINLAANNQVKQFNKNKFGQFFTPLPIAKLMAGMFDFSLPEISLLDAGAGAGSLLVGIISELCQHQQKPKSLHITAYEIDPTLIDFLQQTLKLCHNACEQLGINFTYKIYNIDFIESVFELLQYPLFNHSITTEFTHAILNPPYYKINSQSKYRLLLSSLGLETTNIYTGFIFAAIQLLKINGQLVTITPRSFCNGAYFREFRKFFIEKMALEKIHLFDSRQKVFSDDKILQETVIIHASKQNRKPENISISSSLNGENNIISSHILVYNDIISDHDPEQFIHIIPDNVSQKIVEQIKQFNCTIQDLGLNVSTGKVVDFRIKSYLKLNQEEDTVPLIHPTHFENGYINYPKNTKKHQAILLAKQTTNLLIPNENYVLTKRISAKEEKKRVVAVIYDATKINTTSIGFENHLNYFHQQGQGLDLVLAKGLTAYLNSSLVDSFFRLFNGNTQVNATDLRSLNYPNLTQLYALGQHIGTEFPNQTEIDKLINQVLLNMTNSSENNPIIIKSRIEEAIEILTTLGFPQKQLNSRSGLTLLALLDLKPHEPWTLAKAPLQGITPIMEFMEKNYGKKYAPNTREVVRRQTIHQFIDAGLIVINPDHIERPVNSSKTVYQIEAGALQLLRTFKTDEWDKNLKTYLASIETLKTKYAQERLKARIEVDISGTSITISPGGQNILIEKIINNFCPRFTPNSHIIYVGDTDEKFAYFDELALEELGIKIDTHGKMPDIIIHLQSKNWLVLIEAVTSHGPINAKRKNELENLFKNSQIPLVMVTAFLNRKVMKEYLTEIAWETDVWVAEDATHLIHFNGEHLLQLY